MKIQVFKLYNVTIDGFKGCAATRTDCPEYAFICLNMGLSPEEQQKTIRHELYHILSGHVLRVMDQDGKERQQAEQDAERHETDTTLDRIIKDACLLENAVAVDYQKPTELIFPQGV